MQLVPLAERAASRTVDLMLFDWDDLCGPCTTGAVAQMCREQGWPEEWITDEEIAQLTVRINEGLVEIAQAAERASRRLDVAERWQRYLNGEGPPP